MFLKDVSKQTADDLITYIYNGEVHVASDCLADFMSIAKALDIKGLNGNSLPQPREFTDANHIWPNTAFSGMQYQSSHINQHFGSTSSLNQTKPVQVESTESNYFQSSMDEYGGDEDFDYGNPNEMTANAYNMETSSYRNDEYAASGSYSMKQADDASFVEWGGEDESESQSVQHVNDTKAPTAKRSKRNVGKFYFIDIFQFVSSQVQERFGS